jgi:hypothetical protein
MSCPDCGFNAQSLKSHQQSLKCKSARELNSVCLFRCRGCLKDFERSWILEAHVKGCTKEKPVPPVHPAVAELEKMKIKCDLYLNLLRSVGIPLEDGEINANKPLPKIRVVHVRKGTKDEDTESIVSIETDGTDVSETRSNASIASTVSVKSPVRTPPRKKIVETKEPKEHSKEETVSSVFNPSALYESLNQIKEGKAENSAGENLYYVLGNTLGQLMETPVPEYMLEIFLFSFRKEIESPKIQLSKSVPNYESFCSGLQDSYCDDSIQTFTMINLGFYEPGMVFRSLQDRPEDFSKGLSLQQLRQRYTLGYCFSDFELFMSRILFNTLKTPLYGYDGEQYFRLEEGKWVVDPWMLDLTGVLAEEMIEKCAEVFQRLYRQVYGNNVYRDDFGKTSFLAILFKNMNLAITRFDLNHLLRKKVQRLNRIASQPKMVGHSQQRDEFALMSTRIHYGIPGFDLTENVYDLLFTQFPPEVAETHVIKYLKGLSTYSSEYEAVKRFQEHVKFEAKRLKTELGI